MDKAKIIIVEHLKKYFPIKGCAEKLAALDDVSFSLQAGCLTALVGPDGAGKTTLMRLIAGLMSPSAGSLRVLGRETKGHEQEIQNRISYMPQKFGLYEDLSIQENMNLYADLHGVPDTVRKGRFPHLLAMTGLERFTGRQAGKLSGGMKQKLGLACTLVRSPEILLLDEPTVGVDPLSRRELWEILHQLVHEESLSVFVSTAYMDEAALCQDVLVMNKGRLLQRGTPEDLRHIAQNRCYKVYPKSGMPTRILQSMLLDDKENIVDAVPEGGGVRFILQKDIEESYCQSKFGIQAESVVERLEDGFMILLHADEAGQKQVAFSNEEKVTFAEDYHLSEKVEIEVRDLVRKFGDFIAVANTSFQVHKGEVFGLLGPNGAGKTTTFRMLCGLLPMTSGFLSVAGVNLRTARTQARANVGYVAQKFSLYGNLSVQENLSFFGGAYGMDSKRLKNRMEDVIQEFHLSGQENQQARDLPGGFKQRLSMAVALLHEPKILFLDEPTSGIDPLARRNFWRQITALAAKGTTIIITTHFMEEAEYCDRIMIQDQGKLLAIGTPQEIREKVGTKEQSMNEIFIEIVESAREQKKSGETV